MLKHEPLLTRLFEQADDRRDDPTFYFPIGRLTPVPHNRNHALIYLTSPCYANCVFCGEETTQKYVFSDVSAVLRSIRDRSFEPTKVWIAGFEPLSHPGVPDMVAECRASGISEVELMTTGLPLGNLRTAEALLAAGLTSVAVPLYADEPHLNDLLMRRSGAFDATVRGLDFLHERGCQIHLHSLVLRQNLSAIDRIDKLAHERWNATFVAAIARQKTNFEHTFVALESLDSAVRHAPVLGAPFCFLPRMKDHPDVTLERPLQQTLVAMSDVMRPYFSQGLVQEAPCAGCKYRHACTGVTAEQRKFEPGFSLRPFL
jgi:MoaA/NifB/PqqE/SkfB family radical SAM enzyme